MYEALIISVEVIYINFCRFYNNASESLRKIRTKYVWEEQYYRFKDVEKKNIFTGIGTIVWDSLVTATLLTAKYTIYVPIKWFCYKLYDLTTSKLDNKVKDEDKKL